MTHAMSSNISFTMWEGGESDGSEPPEDSSSSNSSRKKSKNKDKKNKGKPSKKGSTGGKSKKRDRDVDKQVKMSSRYTTWKKTPALGLSCSVHVLGLLCGLSVLMLLLFLMMSCQVAYLKRFMAGIGNKKATKSFLNKQSTNYLRRAFFGLFEKTPFMAVDELVPQRVVSQTLVNAIT